MKKPKTSKIKNKTEADVLTEIKNRFSIVGRDKEIRDIASAVLATRNVLIEGPVGEKDALHKIGDVLKSWGIQKPKKKKPGLFSGMY